MFQPMALPGPAPVISWGEPALSNDSVLAKAGASSRTPNASAESVCIQRFSHFGLEVRWEPCADVVKARPTGRYDSLSASCFFVEFCVWLRRDAHPTMGRRDACPTTDRRDACTTTDRRDACTTTHRRDACTTTDRRDACTTTHRRDACTTTD